MIGTSLLEYLFIRTCIIGLQSVAPLSIILCLTSVLFHLTKLQAPFGIPTPLQLWAVAEVIFYLFVSYVYREKLQHEALHPPAPARNERKELFELCNNNIPDPEAYLEKWFLGASSHEIKRENVKEFFLWAFFNRDGPPGEDDEELEEYVLRTEDLLGRKIEEGRGSAVCLRLTIDGVSMSHRSILWYFCVGFVDCLTCIRLHWYGFAFRRTAFRHFLMIFPWRPITLFATSRSPAKRLTYWHRPHTSRTRRPVVFIHGIGIGLYPYVNFLAQLDSRLNSGRSSKDQVGIIAVEIMPVSFRITHTAMRKDEMCEEIHAIIKHHGFNKPILVSHSYGTVVTTQLLKSSKMANQIGSIVLIDPISILLHLPDVAYNFTRRKPKQANEHQLYYFASMDMGVSHSLSRCFFWSENVLWKNDIGDRAVTVSLAERDLIVNTKAVGSYLATHDEAIAARKKGTANGFTNGNVFEKVIPENGPDSTALHQRSNGNANGVVPGGLSPKRIDNHLQANHDCAEWKDRTWLGKGVDVVWFQTLDHAQVFDKPRTRKPLVEAINDYSARPG